MTTMLMTTMLVRMKIQRYSLKDYYERFNIDDCMERQKFHFFMKKIM
jgi:hypothetical protein